MCENWKSSVKALQILPSSVLYLQSEVNQSIQLTSYIVRTYLAYDVAISTWYFFLWFEFSIWVFNFARLNFVRIYFCGSLFSRFVCNREKREIKYQKGIQNAKLGSDSRED